MSHGDRVTRLPDGFTVKATSENAPFAVASDEKRRIYTTMFHPEVVHTPDGAKLLSNFVHKIAGLKSDWTMAHFRTAEVAKIRAQVGTRASSAGCRAASIGRRVRADPRGDRRPAHLHFRRPRPAPPQRGRGGRAPVPRPLQHSARPRRRARALPRRAGRQARPRGQAQDHRRAVHRRVRRGGQEARRRFWALPVPALHPRSSSPRARSIPTSSKACRSPAARR